jgi:hypothetical protein
MFLKNVHVLVLFGVRLAPPSCGSARHALTYTPSRIRAGRLTRVGPLSSVPMPWEAYDAWRAQAEISVDIES